MTDFADDLRPSVVRDQVLIQHQALRHELGRLEEVAADPGVLLGPERRRQHLVELLSALRDHLRGHLAFEERWLAPLLAEGDVWGPQRVRDLLLEHEVQRARVHELVSAAEGGWDLDRLCDATRRLVAELRADMADEEQGCLSEQLLRDDVVAIDQATD